MAAERIIGVDFGTSTSVIRVKRYQDGKPVGDLLETKPVTFNMGSTMAPTLIQKLPSGDAYFGHEAEIAHRNAKTFQNFKVDIENPDEDIRRQARALTAEYFAYLAKSYRTQSEGGHLGESDDKERTIISYPVKWSNETKAFMVQTAKDAGFPHVEGVDEAQAAIQAVTVQNAGLLTGKGYFKSGVPVNILLIDMGAGTTDLVLCRHTPGAQPKTDILSTWPKGGDALFGGREVDELLKGYISQTMPEDGADIVLKKIGIEKYKAWKEGTVSPALEKGESVDYFSALDDLLNLMDIEAEYSVSRDSFEAYTADYLRQLPELVNGCVSAAGLSGGDVDLVILTGGHSRWYFVREMLIGKLDQFGEIGLGKIRADQERVIPISLPQETVALGLAYMPLKVEVPEPKSDEEEKISPPIVVPEKAIETYDPTRDDVFPLKYDPYSQIRPVIAADFRHTVGLKQDGTVLATGSNIYGICNVNNWRDIVAVAVNGSTTPITVGLKKDGTVLATGINHHGQCDVSAWRDIVAVAAGEDYTIGLEKNGTVLAVGSNTVGQCNVNTWHDIVAIAAGAAHTVGLKKNGTVLAVGLNNSGECNVSDWRDIVAIAAGGSSTVGLKKDGTVIAVGNNSLGVCSVSNWCDIVAIAAGTHHTVGLKKDGTVLAVGTDFYNQRNVSSWRDIVAIAAGTFYTVGLKKDGTVVAIGKNDYGQTNVGEDRIVQGLFGPKCVGQTPWKLF